MNQHTGHDELRAKIRQLIADGTLPRHLSIAERAQPGEPRGPAAITVSSTASGPCSACGEPRPQITYTYPGDRIVRFHAACEALWRQERDHVG
jgi:hypothetical protein